jgi:hypothetical protein
MKVDFNEIHDALVELNAWRRYAKQLEQAGWYAAGLILPAESIGDAQLMRYIENIPVEEET